MEQEKKTNAELYQEAFSSINAAFESIQETVNRGENYGRQAIQNLVYAMEALPGGREASANIRSVLLGAPVSSANIAKARFGTKAKPYSLNPSPASISETDSELEIEAEDQQPGRFKTKATEYQLDDSGKEKAPAAEDQIEGAEAGASEEEAPLSEDQIYAELVGGDLEALAENFDFGLIKDWAKKYGAKPSQGKLATLKRIRAEIIKNEDGE